MIRRAQCEDALGIHDAHMRSIQEVCAQHHSQQEIRGWGHRPFNSERWHSAILNDFVWVVDHNGTVEGYGHLRIHLPEKFHAVGASLLGLYLVPEALGLGFGGRLAALMIQVARKQGASEISLSSTLTAHSFYQKIGFKDVGPQECVVIGESKVRCFPMKMSLY